MGPYTRAALLVVRLAASGFILFGLVSLGLDGLLMKAGHEVELWRLALKTLPLAAGVILWLKSYAIARRLTEDFED